MTKTTPAWFEQKTQDIWQCTLCPHQCRLREGTTGICRIRGVRDGTPFDASYGNVSAAQLDPIEKKPLYHFLPGSLVYSIGGYGCNFRCAFCQNWHIAQCHQVALQRHSPADIVKAAKQTRAAGIAYTYNEPIISHTFVSDVAALAHRAGLCNILVTNGYIQEAPAQALLPLMDAINLDIKSMDDQFYRQHCGGHLQPVLAFAKQTYAATVHLEITNLIIPSLNDQPPLIEELARWIAQELSPNTVLHLSAYHPAYEMDLPSTSIKTVRNARVLARRYLQHVYCGNIPDASDTQNTLCPTCGSFLITRQNGQTNIVGLMPQATCRQCGEHTDIRLC